MPCRTMCTVCGFAALSHSYFIRLYKPCCLKHIAALCSKGNERAVEESICCSEDSASCCALQR
ncbi:hypothetical protein D0T90_00505 [Neisseria animalis]|uniref:Uncharacterized protein n=1 Tax=Neisseria animalis TaxID=492 RepID=A0A5P3MQ29_NEIAN|nr:hypothetical protein D0T90_00505 [Neisseria animalis]ROW32506.1 hypothetical protein CGZ60_05210 [Neisseria animalis]